jgi:two-component system sensor histidine kinase ChvG
MLSIDGNIIQNDISELQYSFLNIFLLVIILTLFLGFIFSKRITLPISRLVKAADNVRNTNNMEVKNLINRNDEIGELAFSLDEMTKDLLNRMDAVASFAADVSHEIKNPLTSLRSAIETFSIIKDEKQKKKLMGIVLEDINRLDRLITDISDASRLDSDLSKDEMVLLNLTSLINGFINIRKEMIKGVHFKLNLRKGLFISGNQSRLIQVFDNLINNSVSFSPKDGEIKIDALKIRGKIYVIFSDQGRGISEGKKDTIFDRFYSDRPTNEKFGKHSGLGLSIVKQILESHKAKIYADNIYNRKKVIKGAKFTIIF